MVFTLIETAKLCGIDPRAWLVDVLARIADHPASPPRPAAALELASSPGTDAATGRLISRNTLRPSADAYLQAAALQGDLSRIATPPIGDAVVRAGDTYGD